MWVGLIVSSICFGFAHAYQGCAGILSTGILGIVFGLVFIASGSLLPGQIHHTIIDLNNGLSMGRLASRSTV
jgi:membrane protease YdiL (CAAX protease family)